MALKSTWRNDNLLYRLPRGFTCVLTFSLLRCSRRFFYRRPYHTAYMYGPKHGTYLGIAKCFLGCFFVVVFFSFLAFGFFPYLIPNFQDFFSFFPLPRAELSEENNNKKQQHPNAYGSITFLRPCKMCSGRRFDFPQPSFALPVPSK